LSLRDPRKANTHKCLNSNIKCSSNLSNRNFKVSLPSNSNSSSNSSSKVSLPNSISLHKPTVVEVVTISLLLNRVTFNIKQHHSQSIMQLRCSQLTNSKMHFMVGMRNLKVMPLVVSLLINSR
jgi:hypothetical protein